MSFDISYIDNKAWRCITFVYLLYHLTLSRTIDKGFSILFLYTFFSRGMGQHTASYSMDISINNSTSNNDHILVQITKFIYLVMCNTVLFAIRKNSNIFLEENVISL